MSTQMFARILGIVFLLIGAAGFVPGFLTDHSHADVTLAPTAEGTTVTVAANADVGGAVARVGQRLMEGVGRTMMNKFFACLATKLGSFS